MNVNFYIVFILILLLSNTALKSQTADDYEFEILGKKISFNIKEEEFLNYYTGLDFSKSEDIDSLNYYSYFERSESDFYFCSIFFKFLSGNLSEIYIQNNSNELVDVELNNFLNAFILIKEIPHEIYGTDSPIPTYIYKKEILIVNITFDRFTFCRIINEEIEKNIKLLSE